MKKKIVLMAVLFCTFFILSESTYGQYTDQEKISEVIKADSVSQEKLYRNAKRWVFGKFMTSDNIVDFDEEKKESIMVTAHIAMTSHKHGTGTASVTDRNTLTIKLRIDLKDGRYKYELSNMQYSFIKQIPLRTGAMNTKFCVSSLKEIEDLPDKVVSLVHAEANEKIGALIAELKAEVAYNSEAEDW